jgi:hypothetical protein
VLGFALALSLIALSAPAASATVHVDPSGPAGQQYALPLDSVRGQASGHEAAGVPGATTPAPDFGQGIVPATTPGPPVKHKNKKQLKQKKHRQRLTAHVGAGQVRGLEGRAGAALVSGIGGGGSMTLDTMGLVGGLLLVGIAAGLIFRRRMPS